MDEPESDIVRGYVTRFPLVGNLGLQRTCRLSRASAADPTIPSQAPLVFVNGSGHFPG